MEGLILHAGSEACTRADLDLVPMPERTDSYQPVGHGELARKLLTITQDILPGFVLAGER